MGHQIDIRIKVEELKKKLGIVDGVTPVKGKDYFTDEEIEWFLKKVTPVQKDRDLPEVVGEIVQDISPVDIRNALESLHGASRLKMSAIKGLTEALAEVSSGGGIGGSGGQGGGANYYAQSLGESSATSNYSTYVNKVTLNVTPIAGTYILAWNYEYDSSAVTATSSVWIKIHNGTTTYSELLNTIEQTYANSGWKSGAGFIELTLINTNMNFYIDFCRVSANTAYIKNAKFSLRKTS